MIALDELLIKIGVDGSQAQQIGAYVNMLQNGADTLGANANAINDKLNGLLNDVSSSLSDASDAAAEATQGLDKAGESANKAGGRFNKLKLAMAALVGGAILFGNKIASAFNSAIDNAKDLFKSKDALYSISQEEIDQADQYKKSLDKTSLSINSIKTKIAINLIPTLTAVSEKFNGWLVTNKDLVTNGIGKVIEWLGKGIQVVTNFIKFIDKAVRSTIGWKNAFIVLGAAWAILNRKFLMSPIGMVIGLFGILLLLIDDLMVYMEGGNSLFGSYWDPLISGAKSVINWFNSLSKTSQRILGGSGVLAMVMALFGKTSLKAIGVFVKGMKMAGVAVKVLTGIMIANPIIAILTAIAVVAYLIYDNWEWLSAEFKKIWANITGFVTKAWDSIVSSTSDAIKDILMYFGMSEEGADNTVSAIGEAFKLAKDLILQPFKDAWEFVKKLFEIWTDDSATNVDKIGASFSALFDFITAPFQRAMKWINTTFNGFIDRTINGITKGLAKGLSFIGIDVDWGKDEEAPTSGGMSMGIAGLIQPSVPSPNNTNNRVNNNNQEIQNNITVYANGTEEGARRIADPYVKNLESASDLIKHRNDS